MRKSALEKIEEELDLKLFEEAFKKNPKTYIFDEVGKRLGFDGRILLDPLADS